MTGTSDIFIINYSSPIECDLNERVILRNLQQLTSQLVSASRYLVWIQFVVLYVPRKSSCWQDVLLLLLTHTLVTWTVQAVTLPLKWWALVDVLQHWVAVYLRHVVTLRRATGSQRSHVVMTIVTLHLPRARVVVDWILQCRVGVCVRCARWRRCGLFVRLSAVVRNRSLGGRRRPHQLGRVAGRVTWRCRGPAFVTLLPTKSSNLYS